MAAAEEGSVISADGTKIGFVKTGQGPALVVVHGSLATGNEWLPMAAALADRFTCYLMDRRGRGRSGDAPAYSLARECEDINAVLDSAGPDAALLGHSYGAICAVEAASRRRVPKLVLYEPPLPIHATVIGPAFADFKAAVGRDDLDGALLIGCRDLIKIPEQELAAIKGTPMWKKMVALTPTWTRECEVIDGLPFGVMRFAALETPTLLLVGTATARHHLDASQALAQTLPDARTVEIPRHGHQAHLTATAQVAAAIGRFLK